MFSFKYDRTLQGYIYKELQKYFKVTKIDGSTKMFRMRTESQDLLLIRIELFLNLRIICFVF